MMKKFTFLLFVSISISVFSQLGTRLPSAKIGDSKWTFGGYAGLTGAFGGGGLGVYLSPRLGYKISENFEAGVSSNLMFQSSKYYSSSTIGIGPFANYYFGRKVYVSGLFQEYFFNQKNKVDNTKYSSEESALYVGGGYLQRISDKVYMQVGGMYNVLYNKEKSHFGGAFVPNIGIVYGL